MTDPARVRQMRLVVRSNASLLLAACIFILGVYIIYFLVSATSDPMAVAPGLVISTWGIAYGRPVLIMNEDGLLVRQSLHYVWLPWKAINCVEDRRTSGGKGISITFERSDKEIDKVESSIFYRSFMELGEADAKRSRTIAEINQYLTHFRDASMMSTSEVRKRWSKVMVGLLILSIGGYFFTPIAGSMMR